MLEKSFFEIYQKFKLHFYKTIFSNFESREASLTAVETFCMETIHAMKRPTINEFAVFMNISQPNAAYKVANLIKKGYVKKHRSETDKREYYIEPTEKYYRYMNINSKYVHKVVERINGRFTQDEIDIFIKVLSVTCEELMPEIQLPNRE